ncbi:MAG TPA: zinc dependent phospholipase C family protein [Flavisolibacter sp.]|jgi:hypothetical protein|nr:zinc dependent phospholipase C family protein [Flavisolibacter sp.]
MTIIKKTALAFLFILLSFTCFSWGFYAHKKINYYAVLLLPPQMLLFYKSQIEFISNHAVDPDKRRYLIANEGAHHFIDIDHYGKYPFDSLPRKWSKALEKYGKDTLQQFGILPWWILITEQKLVQAFKEKDKLAILKISSDLGHYIADAHVPLHNNSNHNGQHTNQEGIHAFWESRIPELFAEKSWNFFIGKANYIENKEAFVWNIILQSAAESDSVLILEKQLSASFPESRKFAYENRNNKLLKQFSTEYATAYNIRLNGMVERKMRLSIYSIACMWYTAWVDAGQPNLSTLADSSFSESDLKEFDHLEETWRKSGSREEH